jgi:CheY-like chemotaxis protein
VLVVDDEADARLLFTTVLADAGFEVEAACDGQQALALCERRDPGVIIVDLVMPVMDGVSFIRAYRARPGGGSARIVVVSAMSGADAVADELGCDATLRKPLDIDDLTGTVVVLTALPPRALA